MSLLNRDLIYSLIAFHDALHSTMSLLNRQVAITSFWIQVSLHSTMSLLNPVFRAFSADSAAAFTFHNVSIKSRIRKNGAGIRNGFTFHNVSIKSNLLVVRLPSYYQLYIPQCLY